MLANKGYRADARRVASQLLGDLVFAAATGQKPIDGPSGLTELGMVAANVIARAIARGVYEATALPFPGALPAWKDLYASKGMAR